MSISVPPNPLAGAIQPVVNWFQNRDTRSVARIHHHIPLYLVYLCKSPKFYPFSTLMHGINGPSTPLHTIRLITFSISYKQSPHHTHYPTITATTSTTFLVVNPFHTLCYSFELGRKLARAWLPTQTHTRTHTPLFELPWVSRFGLLWVDYAQKRNKRQTQSAVHHHHHHHSRHYNIIPP